MSNREKQTQKKGYQGIKNFLETVLKKSKELGDDEIILYRGQSGYDWELKPSTFRITNYKINEDIMLRELVSSYPDDFSYDKTALEILIRAQHYELPTRLLDLTYNPLTALFFATDENIKDDGQVFLFKVNKRNIKYYDSDTAACIANLAFLTQEEKSNLEVEYNKLCEKHKGDKEKVKQEFMELKEIKRLLHFIKMEKVHFDDNINPEDLFQTLVIEAKKNNHRVIAQQGAFVLYGLNPPEGSKPVPGIELDKPIAKLKIAKGYKKKIREQLNSLASINNSSIYPEIIQHAKFIKDKYNKL